MLDLINSEFEGEFDWLYLPIDKGTRVNRGYCFVNMTSEESVQRIWRKFDGFKDWLLPTKKVSTVIWSERQGLQEHVGHFKSKIMNMADPLPEEFRPLIRMNGVMVPFPYAAATFQ